MIDRVTSTLAHINCLAGEIGPRGTGSLGESRAADYVNDQLGKLGVQVERQRFPAVISQNAFAVAIDLVALLAIAVYPLGGTFSKLISTLLGLAAPVLLWQTIRMSQNPLRFLLPKVTSQSVIGRIPPNKEIRRRAVILAHLDTNRCRLAWQSSITRWLEPLTWLTLIMLALPGMLFLAGLLLGDVDWPWWISFLPGGYILGSLVTLWKDEKTPFSPGAHDNAASVAAALEIGRQLMAAPLTNTETWLAFTGAEETDHSGLYALLKSYAAIMRQAIFIGLEGVGGGDIVYLTTQGLCFHVEPDTKLLRLAECVSAKLPQLQIKPGVMRMEDEVATLRRKNYAAIDIAGRDARSGALPYWHRPDDTPDKVSPQALEQAIGFVIALLNELDQE